MRYEARKPFAIHENGYIRGDIVPVEDLERVPGGAEKLVRTGFVIEVHDAR